MGRDRLIVLKFGSSVLGATGDLPTAVQEIYRWRREGWRVIAVVSAAKGATDALLAEARALCPVLSGRPARTRRRSSRRRASSPRPRGSPSRSTLTASPPRRSTPARSRSARAVRVSTRRRSGSTPRRSTPPSNAPESSSSPASSGATSSGATLLGRGGSDLSALFIAHALGARCRLLKDTPGLFESDPRHADKGEVLRRFARLSWSDLPRLGTRAVQPKAAVFAWENQVEFEVAAPLHGACTIVGKAPTSVDDAPTSAPRALRVVLLGHGVVGAGVARSLVDLSRRNAGAAPVEITAIAVRTPSKHERALVELGLDPALLTTDPVSTLDTTPDLVIECLGGLDPATEVIERALRAGVHVVTANKAVIAQHGARLRDIAESTGATLFYCAAVGGAVPALELVRRVGAGEGEIASIRAVLNGTSNFVLSRLGSGASFADAIAAAQAAGFAEADPSRDLSGLDALDKLRILAQAGRTSSGGAQVTSRVVGLDDAAVALVRDAARDGRVVRQVARLTRTRDGVHLSVGPESLDPSNPVDAPLADLADEANGVVVTDALERLHVLAGRGAGRTPTALSVIADVLDIAAAIPQSREFAGPGPSIALKRGRRASLVVAAGEDGALRRAAG